jgi:predicted DNA binding CopG/RHH family protein
MNVELERSRPIGIRFDADTLKRLRRVAKAKGTGYQTLLKTFVMERLYEEEQREGLLETKRA